MSESSRRASNALLAVADFFAHELRDADDAHARALEAQRQLSGQLNAAMVEVMRMGRVIAVLSKYTEVGDAASWSIPAEVEKALRLYEEESKHGAVGGVGSAVGAAGDSGPVHGPGVRPGGEGA